MTLLFAIVLAPVAQAQSLRVWQSPTTGKTFEGTFIGYKEASKEEKQSDEKGKSALGKVTIRREMDNKTADFDLELFSEADRRYVATQFFSESDSKQFELVAGQIESLRQSNDSVIAILKALESQYPTAPYASIWAGVALGAVKNDPEQAQKMCKNCISRIRKQRELDDSRHLRTLAAAYNNSAICYIKDLQPESACRQFILALGCSEKAPAVIAHNIRTFFDIASKGGGLKLDAKELSQLAMVMAKLPLEDSKRKFPPGWYYSLDLDIPLGKESESSVIGVVPPDASLELISTGSGVVCAPGFVVTIRDSVIHPSRTSSLATVATKSSDGRWQLKKARRVLISEPKIVDVSGRRSTTLSEMSGRQSSSASLATDFVIVHPEEGSPSAEFAVLQFEDLNISPARLVDGDVKPGKTIEMIGFERGPNMLSGTKVGAAKVLDVTNKGRWLIDRWIPGGLRGAPIVDDQYRVVGIASRTVSPQRNASKTNGASTACGECLSLDALKDWFSKATKTADLNFESPEDPGADKDRMQNAIVPVLVWGRRSDNEQANSIYSDFYYDEDIVRKLVLRDEWCFKCDGNGIAKCGVCRGSGEVANGYKQVLSGMTQQGPRYTQVLNMVVCGNCNGQRRLKCDECQGGRLPSSRSGRN